MKRDMDLVRKILFFVENEYVPGADVISVEIDGFDNDMIYEHCKLIYQAGLVQKFTDTSTMSGRGCLTGNLSNEGYDYLDKIREDTIWNKTKKVIKEKGLPMVVDTIKAVATALIASATEGVVTAYLNNGGQP